MESLRPERPGIKLPDPSLTFRGNGVRIDTRLLSDYERFLHAIPSLRQPHTRPVSPVICAIVAHQAVAGAVGAYLPAGSREYVVGARYQFVGHRAIRLGDELTAEARVLGAHHLLTSVCVEHEVSIVDQAGEPVAEQRLLLAHRDQRRFDGRKLSWPVLGLGPRQGETLQTSVHLADDLAGRFAELSGDRAPFHMSEVEARRLGFEGRTLQGMAAVAVAIAAIERLMPSLAHQEIETLAVDLGRPIYLDCPFDVRAWPHREGTRWIVGFEAFTSASRRALRNGLVTFAEPA